MVDQALSIPKYWRRIPQYYRLVAYRCVKCGKLYFPPRAVCDCGSREFEEVELPRVGKIVEYTVLRSVTSDFEKQRPLVIAVVDLGGVRVLGQLVDCQNLDKLGEGADVEVVFRRIKEDGSHGIIYYGFKFRPVRGCV